jgi:hypothetical protein
VFQLECAVVNANVKQAVVSNEHTVRISGCYVDIPKSA